MSWRVTAYARTVRDISPTEKLILLILADYAHPETGWAWPTIKALADDACCSERTAQRAIANLIKRGMVERATRAHPENGQSLSNAYRIIIDNGHQPASAAQQQPNDNQRDNTCQPPSAQMTPPGVSQMSPPNAQMTPPGVTPVSPKPKYINRLLEESPGGDSSQRQPGGCRLSADGALVVTQPDNSSPLIAAEPLVDYGNGWYGGPLPGADEELPPLTDEERRRWQARHSSLSELEYRRYLAVDRWHRSFHPPPPKQAVMTARTVIIQLVRGWSARDIAACWMAEIHREGGVYASAAQVWRRIRAWEAAGKPTVAPRWYGGRTLDGTLRRAMEGEADAWQETLAYTRRRASLSAV